MLPDFLRKPDVIQVFDSSSWTSRFIFSHGQRDLESYRSVFRGDQRQLKFPTGMNSLRRTPGTEPLLRRSLPASPNDHLKCIGGQAFAWECTGWKSFFLRNLIRRCFGADKRSAMATAGPNWQGKHFN